MNNNNNAQTISAAATHSAKDNENAGGQEKKIAEGASQDEPKIEPKPEATPASKA